MRSRSLTNRFHAFGAAHTPHSQYKTLHTLCPLSTKLRTRPPPLSTKLRTHPALTVQNCAHVVASTRSALHTPRIPSVQNSASRVHITVPAVISCEVTEGGRIKGGYFG
eukprot:673238-Rhodomonas_salina.1